MKLITLILGLILGSLVGFYCEDEAKFREACKAENILKQTYDDEYIVEGTKRITFRQFLRQRRARIDLGKQLDLADCSKVEQDGASKQVIDDKQLLDELCKREASLQAYLKTNDDKSLQFRLQNEVRGAGWDLIDLRDYLKSQAWAEEDMKCRKPDDEVDVSGARFLATKLKEHFKTSCYLESSFSLIKHELDRAKPRIVQKKEEEREKRLTKQSKMESKESMSYLRVIYEKQFNASFDRKRYCRESIEVCCDHELVEKGKRESIKKAAETMLELVDPSAYKAIWTEGLGQSETIKSREEAVTALKSLYEKIAELKKTYHKDKDYHVENMSRNALNAIKEKLKSIDPNEELAKQFRLLHPSTW